MSHLIENPATWLMIALVLLIAWSEGVNSGKEKFRKEKFMEEWKPRWQKATRDTEEDNGKSQTDSDNGAE